MKHNTATLVRRVRELATEYPTATYHNDDPDEDEECSYTKGHVTNGPPTLGCIIGQAARGYLDIPPASDHHGVGSVLDDLDVEGPKAEREWLENVQTSQDNGSRWSEAVEYADQKGENRIP